MYNKEAAELLNRIKMTGIRNCGVTGLKNGLRNIIQGCRERGFGTGQALTAAENWLKKHEHN